MPENLADGLQIAYRGGLLGGEGVHIYLGVYGPFARGRRKLFMFTLEAFAFSLFPPAAAAFSAVSLVLVTISAMLPDFACTSTRPAL